MLSIRTKAIASNIVTYQAVHTVTILAMPCFVHAVLDLGLAVTTVRSVSRSPCSSHGHVPAVEAVPIVQDIHDNNNLGLKTYALTRAEEFATHPLLTHKD